MNTKTQKINNTNWEMMIQTSLMTVRVCAHVFTGSHKRSHSLGEKEICSTPSPASEQQFRDRSNTLSEKPALPVIRDKYKDLTGEVEVRTGLLPPPLFLLREMPCFCLEC